jgi:uncharacterized membrane protein
VTRAVNEIAWVLYGVCTLSVLVLMSRMSLRSFGLARAVPVLCLGGGVSLVALLLPS